MARRGRCRCGFVLKFHRGEQGYKTRCPECGAVVRLRTRTRKRTKLRLRTVKCTCGYGVLLPFESSSLPCPACGKTVSAPPVPAPPLVEKAARGPRKRTSRASANALPASPPNVARPQTPQRKTTAVACAVCSSIVPTQAKRCPACGAETVRQAVGPASVRNSGPRRASTLPASGNRSKMILGWIGALGALLVVAAVILALLLRH
jgi:predicted RNA-binding Zn-ribbon protein involved in translation (DUF1610 family)